MRGGGAGRIRHFARPEERAMKLKEIAQRLACELEADADIDILGVAGIEHAEPGQLTFVANPRYRQAIRTTRASAAIVAPDLKIEREPALPALAILRSKNPQLDFARAIELFYQAPRYEPGIHPTAVIAPTARIGAGAHIGPYCFVDENVEIGRDATLHSFVTVYRDARIGDAFFAHAHAVVREGCRIGHRVILQNGVVIGGDGFGFAPQPDGRWHKMQSAGTAVLADDVEVQANACVDRATIGETRIERGAKLDDLVLVGHSSVVGEDTLLCGQTGLAGTTTVGKRCILAGQAGSAGHLTIGDGAVITAQSGVPNDVPAGVVYSGYPAVEREQWLQNMSALNQLPKLLKTVRRLEAEVAKLSARAAT
jgi:UDP-3-O-[3-hydroxymyristoyl] glucosamine N-acyltransferase